MTFTVTIPWWLPVGYVVIGLVLWMPLEYLGWKAIHRPPPFWPEFWRGLRRNPWIPLAVMVAWPWALYEELR